MKETIQNNKVPLIVGTLILLTVLAYVYQDKLVAFFLPKSERDIVPINGAAVNTTVSNTSTSNSNRDTILKKGSRGKEVEELQQLLNVKHGSSGPSFYDYLTVDGNFGPATEAMLKKYTGKTSISINGLIQALK